MADEDTRIVVTYEGPEKGPKKFQCTGLGSQLDMLAMAYYLQRGASKVEGALFTDFAKAMVTAFEHFVGTLDVEIISDVVDVIPETRN